MIGRFSIDALAPAPALALYRHLGVVELIGALLLLGWEVLCLHHVDASVSEMAFCHMSDLSRVAHVEMGLAFDKIVVSVCRTMIQK